MAKVDIGDSIEEFIENSQNYQSKLLKYAIENYRKNKYVKITGIFQFMFVDNWNAITGVWWIIFEGQKKSSCFENYLPTGVNWDGYGWGKDKFGYIEDYGNFQHLDS